VVRLPRCQQKNSTENTQDNSSITLLNSIITGKHKDNKTKILTQQLKYLKHNNRHNIVDINKDNDIDDCNIGSLFNENKTPDVNDHNIHDEIKSQNVLIAEQQKNNENSIKKIYYDM